MTHDISFFSILSGQGATATTRIGKYDSNTKQNKLLYSFDKQVCVSSCSLNKEETLLDVDLYHVLLTKYEGYRVPVRKKYIESTSFSGYKLYHASRSSGGASHIKNSEYAKLRMNMFVRNQDEFLLRCVQFYPNHNCETVMELPLELPDNPFHTVKFVSLGFDHYHTERAEPELISMNVFTNRIGSVCVCYSQPLKDKQELMYTMVLVHKGYYILVYLQDHFLHYINTRQEEMLCHSLFLSGHDVDLGMQCHPADVTVLHAEEESCGSLLDVASGKIHAAELSPAYLLQILRSHTSFRCPSAGPPQHLAALHCLLVYMGNDPNLELKIIEWLCDNVSAFEAFDQIQEFILDKKLVPLFQEEDHQQRVLIGLRIYHMWDHPVSSASISREYVRTQLEKRYKNKGFASTSRDKPGFRPDFLPLTYLAKILADIEEQALNPFEEQENVDASFVEETALKQTLILLGFEEK
ncbi:hypothetical protein F2P81_018774 [Scophthalmus maximus]|uniref:Gamma-secretase-activating protein C-terminal domain-containing protein n=1 Tax=Scophthalmus maximus TaxID=52904 RepID=A0A6A4SAN1_SCOMX|nr:hypothetical protein F2P81_018774 [Scophthalmus maximus]